MENRETLLCGIKNIECILGRTRCKGLYFSQINHLHKIRHGHVFPRTHLVNLGKTQDSGFDTGFGIITHAGVKLEVPEEQAGWNEKLLDSISLATNISMPKTHSANVFLRLGGHAKLIAGFGPSVCAE